MPTYCYGCKCGQELEAQHGMREDPHIVCPECGTRMERIPQLSAVHFRGGFSWSNENNGKGRWICGLGKESDPKAYCTSLAQAEEKAKQRGMTYEKG